MSTDDLPTAETPNTSSADAPVSLGARIRTEMQTAWRAGETERRDTLRLLIAAIDYARIDLGHDPDDDEVIRVLQREAKQRRDSIEQYRAGNRDDLADAEDAELTIINEYLPAALSETDLDAIIGAVITEVGATSAADLGNVMRAVMQRTGGRADGKHVSQKVRESLAG